MAVSPVTLLVLGAGNRGRVSASIDVPPKKLHLLASYCLTAWYNVNCLLGVRQVCARQSQSRPGGCCC